MDFKSAVELTGKKLETVFDKYRKGDSLGKDNDGNTFLHQQRTTAGLLDEQPKFEEKEIQELCEKTHLKWDKRYLGRHKTFIASDETQDSYGDIIKQSGWDLERFRQNPAGMWVHDYRQLPISSVIRAHVTKKQLFATHLFALEDDYPFAETVFKMVDRGFLRGNSVGFIPRKVFEIQDAEEKAKLGLGEDGVLFLKQELLEDSICPIGANPAALIQESFKQAASKGILTLDEINRVIKDDNQKTSVSDTVKEVFDEIAASLKEPTFTLDLGNSLVECEACGLEFKWEDELKVAVSGVKCPRCGKPVDQEGKEIPDDIATGKPGFDETETSFRFRVREPGDFNSDTFRTITLKKDSPKINAVIGKLKGKDKPDDPTKVQSLIFPKDEGWTLAKAEKWVKDHPGAVKSIEDLIELGIVNDPTELTITTGCYTLGSNPWDINWDTSYIDLNGKDADGIKIFTNGSEQEIKLPEDFNDLKEDVDELLETNIELTEKIETLTGLVNDVLKVQNDIRQAIADHKHAGSHDSKGLYDELVDKFDKANSAIKNT